MTQTVKSIRKTGNLLKLLPKDFRKTKKDQLILDILESKRSLEEKQVLLLQRAQVKSFRLARKATSKTLKRIQKQLATILSSKKHEGKPHYYLFKSWFVDDNKKQLLSQLIYSMSQLALMREEMTQQSFIYWVGEKFLAKIIQAEKKQKLETIPNTGPGELYFRGSTFKIEILKKLVAKRSTALGRQLTNNSLSLAERKEIRKEMENLKKVRGQLGSGTIGRSTGIAGYGFVSWTDKIFLGNIIAEVLSNSGVIKFIKRYKKANVVELTEPVVSIPRDIGLEYDCVLPFIDCNGFDISDSVNQSEFTVTWKGYCEYDSQDSLYEDSLIHVDDLKKPSVSKDIVKTLKRQINQPFMVNTALLYKILETPDSLKEALMSFLSAKDKDIVACAQYRDIHEYLSSLSDEASKIEGVNKYKQYELKTVQFFSTIKIAILFRNYKLYFPVRLDFRGRLYTVGWPLNPQGNKSFTRKLLRFIDSFMYENDATGQCVQLWSILSNCRLGLQYTGLVHIHIGEPFISRDINPGRPDLYSYLTNRYSCLLEEEISSWEFAKDSNKQKIKNLIHAIAVRNTVKRAVMGFFFGEGRISRAEQIKSIAKTEYDSISGNQENNQFVYRKDGRNNFKNSAILRFAFLLEKLISQELPEVNVFQLKFKKLIKEIQNLKATEGKVNLSWHQSFSMTNAYYMKQSKRARIDSRMMFYRYTFDEDGNPVLDTGKFNASLLANFLHCGDAMLVQFVLESFHVENSDILTIHDAFYTCKEHTEFANKAYIQAIKKLFADDPIRQIVSINGLEWSNISEELQVYFDQKHRERTFCIDRELKATDVLVTTPPQVC